MPGSGAGVSFGVGGAGGLFAAGDDLAERVDERGAAGEDRGEVVAADFVEGGVFEGAHSGAAG